ncbi:MAG: hypothetical protein IJH32_09890 [Ruminococcus sp.]|nr:hypothetical protein [Ruminococcus sp.]
MKFENAYKGVKRIFSAEILSLIYAVTLGCGLIFGLATSIAAAESSEGIFVIFGTLSLVLMIGGGVIGIIAFILKIVGISNAAKDEPAFSTALAFIFISIVLLCTNVVFQTVSPLVADISNTVVKCCELACTLFIIQGVINLANRCNNADMVRKGNNIFKVILAIYTLIIIAHIMVAIFRANPVTASIALILMITAMVLAIVQYLMFLSFLAKAKKMLA